MAQIVKHASVKYGLEHTEDINVMTASPTQGEMGSKPLGTALDHENAHPFRKSFLRLYLCLSVAYMCSATNGFDANTFGKKI